MGIGDLCTISNNGLGSIIVLEGFGLGGHWICIDCLGSSNGDLLTGQELGVGYIEECGLRGLLGLESG